MKKFEFLEHTADVGIRVYGSTLNELFKNAGEALFEMLVTAHSRTDNAKSVRLEAGDLPDLFVAWFNELISIFYAEKFLGCKCIVEVEARSGAQVLWGEIQGYKFNPYHSRVNMEVKAATYHKAKVYQEKDRWVGEVIFDV